MANTILLADDSVTIQKVVELTFMDEDYSVVAVSDGLAALEKVDEVGPDLVIADVHMPGADGYEVCRRTKESHPSIPVLLLVGTFEQFDDQKATAAGADGNLKKPFDSQELLNQVELLIAGSGSPAGASPADAAPADAALSDPAAEIPTAEIPLSAFATPEPAVLVEPVEENLFATAGAPPVADLEPPPLLDEGDADLEETHPAAARPSEGGDEVFELAEEPSPEEHEPVFEPESTAVSVAAPPEAAPPAAPEAGSAPSEAAEPAAREEPPARDEPAAQGDAVAKQAAANGALSEEDVERIARKVAEQVGERMLREVAWEVIPDLAEVIIKERIRELESQVE